MKSKDIKILAVDDVESNRVSLQYLINEYMDNIELYLATSGEDALRITYKEDIDIIILDVQMPGLDGFETAKYLKSNPKTKNIPIIFLTAAFKKEEFQQKGFELGAIDYLTKPIEDLQLINKLKLYIQVIIKNKQLQAINEDLHRTLQKEIELKKDIEKQQIELIQQSKMAALGEMIGNIAHQWRQPLSVISTSASGIKLNIELNMLQEEDAIKNLNTIVKTTENLSQTIEAFKDYTYKEKLNEFSLNELIQKCINQKEYIFEENNLNIVLDLEEDIKITNLPNSLCQSLVNIFQNAKEALDNIKDEKYIFLKTEQKEDHIVITIKDNAGGISTENINKIFEPYFTTKHKAHGIGLGLNIVYRIIHDSMNGKIKVRNSKFTYNDKQYEGAEFIIKIPLSL